MNLEDLVYGVLVAHKDKAVTAWSIMNKLKIKDTTESDIEIACEKLLTQGLIKLESSYHSTVRRFQFMTPMEIVRAKCHK